MLQLINPIWLLAIGAIVVPIAIHLWNIKKGKTLKIGSIRLVGESSRQNSQSLRLQNLWLLFLRCLLLVILALLLTKPTFNQPVAEDEKIKGWVLLEKDHLAESYSHFKPEIDSLLEAGYETRYFNLGFEPFNLADLKENEGYNERDSTPQLPYWSLAKALDDHLPPHTDAFVFTNNRLNRFTGTRPQLKSQISWKTYDPSDTVYTKISAAYITQTGSLRLILGHSKSGGTTYSMDNTSLAALNPAYQLTAGEKTGIRFNSSGLPGSIDSAVIPIDTATFQIALFTDQFSGDLAYLKAALEAVKTYSQRKISIKTYNDPEHIPAGLNWLFWLSEKPLPVNSGKKAQNTFSYQAGKTLRLSNSVFVTKKKTFLDLENVAIYQNKSAAPSRQFDEPLWEDPTGNPLLTVAENNARREYKFYSQFDPEWSELVWNEKFPEALLSLMFANSGKTTDFGNHDRRSIAFSQVNPAIVQHPKTAPLAAPVKQTPLERSLWLILILIFGLERWASYKQKPTSANG